MWRKGTSFVEQFSNLEVGIAGEKLLPKQRLPCFRLEVRILKRCSEQLDIVFTNAGQQ